MIVTTDTLQLALPGIKTIFNDAYIEANAEKVWPEFVTQVDTTLPTQNYAWLGRGAVMELFKDEAREQLLNQYSYSLTDNIYKGKMVVERKAFEDDQYSLIKLRTQELGDEAPRFEDELMFATLEAGFANLCYDGQYFFDVDHSDGGVAAQSNTSSAALSDPALEAAEKAMMLYVDDKGKPMRVVPDTLIVGPNLARRAWNLMNSGVVVVPTAQSGSANAITQATDYGNYFNGRYKVIVSPYITGYHWFLACTKRRIKGLVLQKRTDVPVTLETDMDLATAQIKEEYQFVVRERMVPGYGLWQLMYGSNATS